MTLRSPEHPAGHRLAAILVLSLAATMPGWALDGGNNVRLTSTGSGWKTFEIITGNDTLGTLDQEGFTWTSKHDDWDGVGAYRHDNSTLRVFINHEAGSGSTFSRVDLNVANLKTWAVNGNANNSSSNQVAAPGQIVTAVSRGWLTVGSGTNPINNPCSGNVWMADTFGPGRGFADTLYLTGEETFNTSGQFWVMDVATRTIYECPALGGGSWENGCIIDTGRTDTVAIFLAEDDGSGGSGTAPLRLYVGQKTGTGFLERNGLTGGTVYHWDPVGGSTNGTMSGIFSGGNGAVVSGTWRTTTSGSANFSKLEDVHTNVDPTSPGFGVEVAVASQGEAVFTVDFSQVDFVAGNLGTNRDSDLLVLFEAGTQSGGNNFSGMDNLVWSADGNIYVNEDDGEGDIWKIDVDSLLDSYAGSDFTPSAAQVSNILDANSVSETSGIIDISEHVGYEPGGIFLASGQSSTLANNQLVMLVAPGATAITYNLTYAAGVGGSLTGTTSQVVGEGDDGTAVTAVPSTGYAFNDWSDGVLSATRVDTAVVSDLNLTANFVVTSHYLVWMAGYPSLAGPDTDPDADPDADGVRNDFEYASNLDPTVQDAAVLTAGTGTAGMPRIELRTFGPDQRLVVEFIRRLGDPDLSYLPQFNPGLGAGGWGAGGTETVTPINATFQRVVREDTVNLSASAPSRFARMRLDLAGP